MFSKQQCLHSSWLRATEITSRWVKMCTKGKKTIHTCYNESDRLMILCVICVYNDKNHQLNETNILHGIHPDRDYWIFNFGSKAGHVCLHRSQMTVILLHDRSQIAYISRWMKIQRTETDETHHVEVQMKTKQFNMQAISLPR